MADDGGNVDGIIYPSTMRRDFNNIVLFSTWRSLKSRFDGLRFIDANHIDLSDCDKLVASLMVKS